MAFSEIAGGSATSPLGFQAGVVTCGLKESGTPDLALLLSERDCTAAGVFTRNQVVAAPVILDRETLAANNDKIRGVLANAGIANACTGQPGLEAAHETQQAAAAATGLKARQFLLLSTGVIGVPLPVKKIKVGIGEAVKALSVGGGPDAARAIMTTDTRPKHLALRLELPGGEVTLGGMAKGAGMIHPNMATMLALITTDAAIPPDRLQALLGKAVESSFNRITIDGDTSTNDTVLLLANGASGVGLEGDDALETFSDGLNFLCAELAKSIVRDGEGVTRFVAIRVSGARDVGQAHLVASTIATSPLVKTALAGGDPNWGRILAAAGRAGVAFDQNRIALWVGNPYQKQLQLVSNGTPTHYAEEEAGAIFTRPEIDIHLDLAQGQAEATVWTGDLTHEYVTINADYRT